MSRRVLVVDDSRSMRQMVAHTLETAGYSVVEAADGREALDHLGSGPVHLIITDLNMPVMDGIALIRNARARAATAYTPILMLTTEGGETRKAEGKAAGATGWMVKPFDPDKLLQVVAKVVP